MNIDNKNHEQIQRKVNEEQEIKIPIFVSPAGNHPICVCSQKKGK
jgi:hypothetical protein